MNWSSRDFPNITYQLGISHDNNCTEEAKAVTERGRKLIEYARKLMEMFEEEEKLDYND